MKGGGYGLKKDITLALAGSIGLCGIVRAVGVFPSAGWSRWRLAPSSGRP
jgi:hypothetical protein